MLADGSIFAIITYELSINLLVVAKKALSFVFFMV